jgi:hypothetical protein
MSDSNLPKKARKLSVSLLFSLTIHLGILFIISLLGSGEKTPEPPTIVVTQDWVPPEDEVKRPEPIIITKPLDPTPVDVTTEPVVAETNPVTPVDIDCPIDEPPVEDIGALMDLPPADTASELPVLAILNNGSPSSSGPGKPFGTRSGPKFNPNTVKNGIDQPVIDAVEAALKWLATHQEPDGSWDATKYEGQETGEKMAETAIALLAFLGAGQSEISGEYKTTVRAGVRYLNSIVDAHRQKNKGLNFGRTYGSSIILMALSEASIFGSSPLTKSNANAIAEALIKSHQGTQEGWLYNGAGDDFSVSGWVALALKSAKMADLPALKDKNFKATYLSYKDWVHKTMANPETGMARYRGDGDINKGSRNMSLVAMVVKHGMSYDMKDPFMQKAVQHGETWAKALLPEKPRDSYGIYYGTLAAYMCDDKFWELWNAKMKVCLVKSQRQGEVQQFGGSWDPTDSHTGKHGGRVMDTALFALCLEVYYRYDRNGA